MKKLIFSLLLLAPCLAGAQAVLTASSYQNSITLPVPTAKAGALVAPVPAGAPTAPVIVTSTFSEAFNSFDPAGSRWATHYDGGAVPGTRSFIGADNPDKRTQKGMAEQQLYVDPAYPGSGAAALGINPFGVAGGALTITADLAPAAALPFLYGHRYTSGMISSREAFAQQYGYFECRMKAPFGAGSFPACWLLPLDNQYRLTGSLPEIDIMEGKGNEPGVIITTAHWKNPATGTRLSSGCRNTFANYQAAFHQYGMYWTPEKIVWYVDRVPVCQIATPADTHTPMYLQANLAIGGTWAGNAADADLPQRLLIDSITIWSTRGPGKDNCLRDPQGVTVCVGP